MISLPQKKRIQGGHDGRANGRDDGQELEQSEDGGRDTKRPTPADEGRNHHRKNPAMSGPTRWHDASGRLPGWLPDRVRPWVALNSSMTRALRQHMGGALQLHVLRGEMGAFLPDEALALGTGKSGGYVREVVLGDGKRPWIAARTVSTRYLPGQRHSLSKLGSRPLGEWLFARGSPRWTRRECTTIQRDAALQPLVRRAAGYVHEACWARRTVFIHEGHRLLVTEIFMPAMWRRRWWPR